MPGRVRHIAAFVIAIGMVIAVASAPTLARVVDDTFSIAGINADKVDGRHAVGAGASRSARKNKLVATNGAGLLPSNIIKPLWSLIKGVPAVLADGNVSWGEVTGKPAGFADGVDDGAYVSTTYGPYSVNGFSGTRSLIFDTSPNIDVQFSVIPVTDQGVVDVLPLQVERMGALVRYRYTVSNPGFGSVQVKFRTRAYSLGISPAALEQQLKDAVVTVVKSKARS